MSMFATPKVVIFFKPVPGGFVYAAPKPWLLFGRTHHYLVTEAQKEAITAASQPPSFVAMFAKLITIVTAGVGAAMALNWYRHSYQFTDFTFGDIGIIFVATMFSMLLAYRVAFGAQVNRLHSLIATLPKSDVRISIDDARRAMMDMNTTKQLWLQTAFSAVVAALYLWFVVLPHKNVRAMLSGEPVSILLLIGACMIVLCIIGQFRMALQKTMEERTRA